LFSLSDDGVLCVSEIEKGHDASESIQRIVLSDAGIRSQKTGHRASITAWLHPQTYLNKLLLGDAEGSVFLLNFRSGTCVHSFEPLDSSVTAMDQSCAVDCVALGLADGRILLRNIKFDETLAQFRHADGGVTALSFRSDVSHLLASASSSGGVYVWDLEKQQLVASLPQAHDSSVCTCRFLQGEAALLTTGADNAVKMWVFDQEDGSARLLRQRSGHSAPPTRVRYYAQDTLLSAGLDRSFRTFSTIQDQQSRELSQGRVAKKARALHAPEQTLKLPPVVDFAASPMREGDWCNILTCHENDGAAYTWSYAKAVIGKHVLRPPPLAASLLADAAGAGAAKKRPAGEEDVFARINGRLPGQVHPAPLHPPPTTHRLARVATAAAAWAGAEVSEPAA
jgi:U3 small nucleolar RNA-associated protein 21